MPRGNIGHKGFVIEGALDQVVLLQRSGRYSGIQMSFLQVLDDGFGILFLNDQVHLGIPVNEGLQEHGQQGGHDRGDDPEGKGTTDKPLLLVHDILDACGFIDDGTGLFHNFPSCVRNADGLFAPVEYLDVQFILQFLHLHAQGRLGNKAFFGCQGKVAVFRHGQDILQLGNGHKEYNDLYKNINSIESVNGKDTFIFVILIENKAQGNEQHWPGRHNRFEV